MLTWTEIQRKLWSPVLESKDVTACSVSSSEQLSSPHYLRHTLSLSCFSLTARTEQEAGPLTVCDFDVSPCPRHREFWAAEPELSPAPEMREKHWSRLRDGRRRSSVLGWGLWFAGLAEPRVFRVLISLQFQMLKLRWQKCFIFVNSLNSAGAIKMQMCFWSANSNAQESQGFIFLNCPNRQVPVGFFFTTEDGKIQFKSIRNLTRLDHCEAQ